MYNEIIISALLGFKPESIVHHAMNRNFGLNKNTKGLIVKAPADGRPCQVTLGIFSFKHNRYSSVDSSALSILQRRDQILI